MVDFPSDDPGRSTAVFGAPAAILRVLLVGDFDPPEKNPVSVMWDYRPSFQA